MTSEPTSWEQAAETIASERLAQADRAEEEGRFVAAFAQMALNFDEPAKSNSIASSLLLAASSARSQICPLNALKYRSRAKT
ncbi:anaerobic selenocysteine-containing dehydrogenase [Rhizobium petrolearium]|uniref:hypothetical protein n=1 Tax=Neorhizobium petrolearium TaxID=515361 RepID=UPI001AE1B398|nr:hypothetical protein [Neorhizobium petrolearium]MBP1847570.1 anaerobic selenocysteine-containing dehydrogenase [Neorhizobium petrolearium]